MQNILPKLLPKLPSCTIPFCALQVRRLLGIIKACSVKTPENVDRVVLRRAAHSLAELSKSGMQLLLLLICVKLVSNVVDVLEYGL